MLTLITYYSTYNERFKQEDMLVKTTFKEDFLNELPSHRKEQEIPMSWGGGTKQTMFSPKVLPRPLQRSSLLLEEPHDGGLLGAFVCRGRYLLLGLLLVIPLASRRRPRWHVGCFGRRDVVFALWVGFALVAFLGHYRRQEDKQRLRDQVRASQDSLVSGEGFFVRIWCPL